MIRHTLLLTIFSLLIACQSSPPRNYYLLSPSTPVSVGEDQPITQLVGIGPIEIADYLDRLNIVRMDTDNSLNVANNEFWAEPLDKGILRVLALNLTQQNPSRIMQEFPWRSDSIPAYSLRLIIHELVVTNNKAMINATWKLIHTESKRTVERQHFVRTLDSGTKAETMAESYSQLLSQLADTMNKALEKVE
jgi:uncharacterized lipoprotein YmbA